MWRSPLDKAALRARAKLLARLRCFFSDRDVIEVDVPVVGASTVTDPYLSAISAHIGAREYYLQTSPEFFMKRLLAGGSGDIYYLGKAFRNDEVGRRHNPEFTMLEWYRVGFDEQRLIEEVLDLIRLLDPGVRPEKITYREVFVRSFGIDPHLASVVQLATLARERLDIRWDDDSKSGWLDLLFSHIIEPSLLHPTVIYDYPECQCALAKVQRDSLGERVGRRFELYWQGIELANGYWELTDAHIQQTRFDDDCAIRRKNGAVLPEHDAKLLAAMQEGLPGCAGVALGVDRLMMCLQGLSDIRQVQAFPFERL